MSLLTERQKERIREALYNEWGTCENCMYREEGEAVWVVSHTSLMSAMTSVIEELEIADEVDYTPSERMNELVEELKLTCPECGCNWDSPWVEVGEYPD